VFSPGIPCLQAWGEVNIPPGTIALSLDRSKSSGHFTRDGIAWYASMLIFSGAPETPDDINSLINHYVEECLSILRNSEALNDLDLESEDGVHTAAERVGSTDALRGSLEQWAFTVLSALAETTQAFDQNNAQRAAWAMNRATSAHAMLVLRRDLEDTMWRGYVTQSLRDVLQIWQDNQHNADEEFWQQTFAARPLVLSQAFAAPIIILEDKAYVGGKGIDNRQGKVTDFLIAGRLSQNAALIEIKTPKTRLLGTEYRAGVHGVSQEVSGAIVQVATQRDSLLKEYYGLVHKSAEPFSAFSPHGLVIAGNLQDELADMERKQSFELFRQGLRDVQLITYDELFSKVESLLESLEGG
jgi:Domain of unknown function (DUF4263)